MYKCFCCITDPIFPAPYNFSFGSPLDLENNKIWFESNFVRTSKYRWYDFLPSTHPINAEALVLQFKRLANIYFLIIAVLQTIPIISPLGPLTAWAPLIVVLGISIVREGTVSPTQATKITSAISPTSSSTTNSRPKCTGRASSCGWSGARS